MSGGGFRVSIPNSVKKTIQDIKEITGDHSDDEIYTMLKECNMDPNETAQKLLFQDPFHEVKRKRDKRKENLNNREPAEPWWRPGMQGKGGRGGRGNFLSRHAPHDAGGGRNTGPGTENGPTKVAEKGVAPSLPISLETKSIERSVAKSSDPVITVGPTNVATGITNIAPASQSSTEATAQISLSIAENSLNSSVSPTDANKIPTSGFGYEDLHEKLTPISSSLVLPNPASTLTPYFSTSDPVLVPSNDARLPGSLGTIKREVGSHHPPASESSSSLGQGKATIKAQGFGKTQPSAFSHPSSSSTHGGSGNRPTSNSSNRSKQLIGTQKAVGTNKEWKPKPIVSAAVPGQATTNAAASEVAADSAEGSSQSQPVSSVLDLEEATSKLQKKLEELHLPQLPQRKLVILPYHIHVPESERNKLSFGSFGATFGVTNSYVSEPESEKSSTPRSDTCQVDEDAVEEHSSSNESAPATADESNFPDHPQSPTLLENLSPAEGDVSSSATQGHNESKHDTALPSGGHQFSVANTSPNYSFGIVPPFLGSQLAAFENSESQARDLSRVPNFVVQQPFDPASYYAQFYRSGTDSDGRLSPFPSPGISAKYSGSVGVLPPSSQPPQEGGVLSAAGPTPMVTQAPPGLVQSSIGATQQPVPVFRPPAGMHISHYPANYIPFNHYYNPFYVAPPIHQYMGNGAFPQQPQAGGVYPPPPPAAATGVKYSLPQYKAGTNTGNSNHMGMASGYGPYGSSPAGYNPSPATTAENNTANDDLNTSQFKDNNAYITGQQSEGSSVWVAAPNREMSSLQSSFYNLHPQGQHMTFTPTQAGHGSFAGLYHPAQAVSGTTVHPLLQESQTMAGVVDMVGPGGNVYQQPQHAQQINWPSNY